MSRFELKESFIRIEGKKNRHIDVSYDSKPIVDIKESLETLVRSLVNNKLDWKKNENMHLMNLICKCNVFVLKYKNLKIEDKKDLILKLIMKHVDENVKNLGLTEEYLQLLNMGIDTIVEPALELAILTSLKKLKLKKSILSCLGL